MVIAKNKKAKLQMDNNVNMNYNWTLGPEEANKEEVMNLPKAVFIPHANSLPFEERYISFDQPIKIGRNVYRATPSPTNAIFECRVLSRHHATLYYDKGHFYLVDNQSSNGTFINNNKCSISKDQEPHEVFSDDVIQFGISVVENTANSEKNTFPPVVAQLKLYHPDGKEAKRSFNLTSSTPLHFKEFYQLNTYIQEAIEREASLEARLRALRECVARARGEAAAAWQLFVGEQRLLMRVRTLEAALANNHHCRADAAAADQQLAELLDDKKNYQEAAQEALRAAHEERLALEESLDRRSCEAAALRQHNCSLRLAANAAHAELQKLAARCEHKLGAARLAIAAAELRENRMRDLLPLVYSIQYGEARMMIVCTDSNKTIDRNDGSLEEAILSLPDYIKLLLPQHLLSKMGMKVVPADASSLKEIELILEKSDVYESENREKQEKEERGVIDGEKVAGLAEEEGAQQTNHVKNESECAGQWGDNNANPTYSDTHNAEESTVPHSAHILIMCAEGSEASSEDDSSIQEAIRSLPEYIQLLLPQHLINKVSTKVVSTDVALLKKIETFLKNKNILHDGEDSKESNVDRDLEKASEPVTDVTRLNHVGASEGAGRWNDNANDDTADPNGLASVVLVIGGLNAEIAALRSRVAAGEAECELLRATRDQLLAAEPPPRRAPDPDAAMYAATIAEIQGQLTQMTSEKEAHQLEIQRLTSVVAELQAKLALSPAPADIDNLTATVGQLRAQLSDKERPKRDKNIATSKSLEELTKLDDTKSISDEIDEMFRLDEDDDEDTDSVTTEVAHPRSYEHAAETPERAAETSELAAETPDLAADGADYVTRLDEELRLQETYNNGVLHELEEELVRAKERWAEESLERARLAARLAQLESAPKMTAGSVLAVVLPLLAAFLFYLLLPNLS